MQLPLMRSSPESTAAVTKLANPMFVMKRPRFSTCRRLFAFLPFGDADLAAQHAGIHADVRDRLGQAESAAPGLTVFARLRRRSRLHVVRRAAQACRARESAPAPGIRPGCGRRAGIHPCQLERDQRQREVLRPRDESALLRAP